MDTTSKECVQQHNDYRGTSTLLQWGDDKTPEQLIALLDELGQQGIRPHFDFPSVEPGFFRRRDQFYSHETYLAFLRVVLTYPFEEVRPMFYNDAAFVLKYAKDIQSVVLYMHRHYADRIPACRQLFEANPHVRELHFTVEQGRNTGFIDAYADDIDAITAINEARAVEDDAKYVFKGGGGRRRRCGRRRKPTRHRRTRRRTRRVRRR